MTAPPMLQNQTVTEEMNFFQPPPAGMCTFLISNFPQFIHRFPQFFFFFFFLVSSDTTRPALCILKRAHGPQTAATGEWSERVLYNLRHECFLGISAL